MSLTHSPSFVQGQVPLELWQSLVSDPAGHRPVISSQSPSSLHRQVSQSAESVPAEQRPVPPGSSHQPSLVQEQIAQSSTSVLSAHRPVPPGSSYIQRDRV